MKSVLAWIKSNLVTVFSAIVVLLSLCVIFYSLSYGGKASEEASGELKKMATRIDNYSNVTVSFPPEEVDAPLEDIPNVTINEATLKHLSEVYGGMSASYKDVYDPMFSRNKAGHDLLVPGVLPKTDANHLRHEARTAYRQAFTEMLEPYDENAPDAARLNAVSALNPAELQFELQRVEEGYRPTGIGGGPGGGGLSETDRKQLEEQKADRAIEMLNERAWSGHIYTDTYMGSPGFPFTVGAWSLMTDLPSYTQIWNSHFDLWVQQDIVRAIGLANKVSDPESSVIESPVKRLISIDVIPGSVGIDTLGGMGVAGTVKQDAGGGGMGGMGGYGMGMGMGGYGMGGQPGGFGGGGGGAAAGEEAAAAAPAGGSPDEPLSVDFHIGPSGRISNSIYDVRHARVVMVVDYQKLPELFNAISSVNFMTVLDCQIKDVDEYQALLDGYVYGQGDAVQVDMLIESIWLREWTTKWMPSEIKKKLGIADPAAEMVEEEPAM